jgi:hypothetical protein
MGNIFRAGKEARVAPVLTSILIGVGVKIAAKLLIAAARKGLEAAVESRREVSSFSDAFSEARLARATGQDPASPGAPPPPARITPAELLGRLTVAPQSSIAVASPPSTGTNDRRSRKAVAAYQRVTAAGS